MHLQPNRHHPSILNLSAASSTPTGCRGDLLHAGGFLDANGGDAFRLHDNIPLHKRHEGVGSAVAIFWNKGNEHESPYFSSKLRDWLNEALRNSLETKNIAIDGGRLRTKNRSLYGVQPPPHKNMAQKQLLSAQLFTHSTHHFNNFTTDVGFTQQVWCPTR
jgi:hypothetical protein